MKMKLTTIKTMAVLATLGLGLSGCFGSDNQEMMDDTMTTPMEIMEKDMMHKDSMDGSMSAPMDTMEKDSMGSDMSDTMK